VKAVILLFPIDGLGESERKEEDERLAKDGQSQVDDTIFWVKQTVRVFTSPSLEADGKV
jgi:hypothetical protein